VFPFEFSLRPLHGWLGRRGHERRRWFLFDFFFSCLVYISKKWQSCRTNLWEKAWHLPNLESRHSTSVLQVIKRTSCAGASAQNTPLTSAVPNAIDFWALGAGLTCPVLPAMGQRQSLRTKSDRRHVFSVQNIAAEETDARKSSGTSSLQK
jgi:hypothetical protein